MDQGHERAATRLGSIYLYGEYAANDYGKARECFEKAPNEPMALRRLGEMVGLKHQQQHVLVKATEAYCMNIFFLSRLQYNFLPTGGFFCLRSVT